MFQVALREGNYKMIWGQVLVLLVMIMCCKLYCGWWGQTLTLHTMHCAQATMLHRGFRSAKKNGVEVNEEQVIPFFIGPESDHWQCLSVTDSLTHSLTDSLRNV